jgi:hypothetical protein
LAMLTSLAALLISIMQNKEAQRLASRWFRRVTLPLIANLAINAGNAWDSVFDISHCLTWI